MPDLVTIRRQMNELGVTAKVISITAGRAYPEFGENAKDFAENVSPIPGGMKTQR